MFGINAIMGTVIFHTLYPETLGLRAKEEGWQTIRANPSMNNGYVEAIKKGGGWGSFSSDNEEDKESEQKPAEVEFPTIA